MIRTVLACALFLAVSVNGEVFFKETFDNGLEGWVDADRTGLGKFEVTSGKFAADEAINQGLQTSQDAKFYGIAKAFPTFTNKDKPVVIQFSAKNEQNIDCGGAYVKVLSSGENLEGFDGDSEYNVMFGPDICGQTKKVHVILSYKGVNYELSKNIPAKTDIYTHVYTLIIQPDNTYEVQIDGKKVEGGDLFKDFDFLPAEQIDDPEISKPNDWVDEAMIVDPEDVKPEGYDEILPTVEDPSAVQPDDWDEEDDGEWEPPIISNPEYKGPWSAKKIANVDYKGPWVQPQIANPDYFEDDEVYVFESFGAIGVDVWQVKSGTIFDNIIITDDIAEAKAFRDETFTNLVDAEKDAEEELKAADAAVAAAAQADFDEDEDDYDFDEDEEDEDLHDEL